MKNQLRKSFRPVLPHICLFVLPVLEYSIPRYGISKNKVRIRGVPKLGPPARSEVLSKGVEVGKDSGPRRANLKRVSIAMEGHMIFSQAHAASFCTTQTQLRLCSLQTITIISAHYELMDRAIIHRFLVDGFFLVQNARWVRWLTLFSTHDNLCLRAVCRLTAYIGHPTLVADLVTRPTR